MKARSFRLVGSALLGALGVLAGCGEEAFHEECPEGTEKRGTACVVPAPKAGAAGASGASAGAAGSTTGGASGATAGAGGQGGAGAPGKGGAGGAGAGGAGAGGAGAGGAGSAGEGGSGGSSGTSGQGGAGAGAGGSGGAGKGGAGTIGAGAGGAGASGTGGAGMSGAGNGGSGAGGAGTGGVAGTGGAGAGGAGAGGTGGLAGAGGDTGSAGDAGSAGAGGAACDVASCPTPPECYDAICGAAGCDTKPSVGGTTCAAGVCDGAGSCGECVPKSVDCDGKTPRTCGDDGKWVAGDACAISCSAGACVTVTSMAAAGNSCALISDGTVRCWNFYGPKPFVASVVADVGAGASALSMSSAATCVVRADGTVWCWGDNNANDLGRDKAEVAFSKTPLQVPGLADVKTLFSGAQTRGHCAITNVGELWCWGNKTVPAAKISGVPNPTTGAIGGLISLDGKSHAFWCARTVDSSVYCWGTNDRGQCGVGYTSATVDTPTKLAIVSDVYSLGSGAEYTCARTSGAIQCWGTEYFTNKLQLEPFNPLAGVFGLPLSLTVGEKHACSRNQNGKLYCWQFSQSASDASPAVPPGESLVSSGQYGTCALHAGDDVQCWNVPFATATPHPIVWELRGTRMPPDLE